VDDDGPAGYPPDDDLHSDFAVFVKTNANSRFLPAAIRYAMLRALPQAAADDILQEALTRSWLVWESKFFGTPSAQRCASVYTTMLHVAQEEQRKYHRTAVIDSTQLVDLPAGDVGPEQRLLGEFVIATVARALNDLPEDQRMIIELAMVGVSRAEIAIQLGLKTATNVTSKLHRARTRLARSIGPDLLAEYGLRFGTSRPGGGHDQ